MYILLRCITLLSYGSLEENMFLFIILILFELVHLYSPTFAVVAAWLSGNGITHISRVTLRRLV